MEKQIRFIYKEEFWYISAMINEGKVDCKDKAAAMLAYLTDRLRNLTETDLKFIKNNKKLVEEVQDLAKHIILNCEWVPFIEYFPFYNENAGLLFNKLGYFRFAIAYFAESPNKREEITATIIQQIPILTLNILKEFAGQHGNQYILLDLESPIFIFVTSDTIKDEKNNGMEVAWTEETIQKYKKILAYWTVLYSGQWPDYSDDLYTKRVQGNLSNRLSELHFIFRNSGFIYMAKENYERHFGTYMIRSVLEPTAQVRAMLFALMAVSDSLDTLFSMKEFLAIKTVEEKIESLRNTRGMIQTKMSIIYNELDYNRREHYTAVLNHLLTIFNLRELIDRINSKFDAIADSMDVRYQKATRENQGRVERSMAYLNVLFGLAGISQVLQYVFTEQHVLFGLSSGILMGIMAIFLLVLRHLISTRRIEKQANVKKTVDAIIFDEKNESIVMIKRRWPPFKGWWALPGGLIEKGESPEQALKRESEEETGLKLNIEGKVGVYDDPDRDPRGRVITTAFFCSIIGPTELKCSDESIDLRFIPLKELKGVNLAFDHELILKDAVEKFLKKTDWN
jgi:8-oxo-dGTP diphosphatase